LKSLKLSKSNSMLSQRVKAALIFVPLTLILIYIGGWPFNLFITGVLLFAAYEFTRLFQRMGYHPSFLITALGILLIIIQRWFFEYRHLSFFLTLFLFIMIVSALIEFERGKIDSATSFVINLIYRDGEIRNKVLGDQVLGYQQHNPGVQMLAPSHKIREICEKICD